MKCVFAQRTVKWLLPSSNFSTDIERLSIVIPARNEESDIIPAVKSILNQEYIDMEVIIVNDHSDDNTGTIINRIAETDSRVKVIHDPPLKEGWLGKCNAMQHGANIATGEFLIFTDADIIHSPKCFSTTLDLMLKNEYDFLSLFPLFENYSFWENVNLPIYFFGIAKLLAVSGHEDPGSPNAIASGALMLIKTRVFRAIEGFNEVRNEMLDDIGLARVLKSKGYRVGYRLAPEYLKVRLFKNNRDAFWGTTKNILTAVEGHVWLAIPLVIMGITQNLAPLYTIGFGLFHGKTLIFLTGLIAYLIQYLGFFSIRRLMKYNPVKLLFFPLSAFVGTCCVIRALYYHLKGSIFWRGREISVVNHQVE